MAFAQKRRPFFSYIMDLQAEYSGELKPTEILASLGSFLIS